MSLMTENKAKRILKDYMDAELSGDNDKAETLENQLNEAGWKISVGPEGYTVIRENGGLFTPDTPENTGNFFYQTSMNRPTNTNTNQGSSNAPLIIGISVGVVILIIAIVLGVRAFKQQQNVVAG